MAMKYTDKLVFHCLLTVSITLITPQENNFAQNLFLHSVKYEYVLSAHCIVYEILPCSTSIQQVTLTAADMYVCCDNDCRKHFACKTVNRSISSTLCYYLDLCHKIPLGSSSVLYIKMDFVQFSKLVAQIFCENLASF